MSSEGEVLEEIAASVDHLRKALNAAEDEEISDELLVDLEDLDERTERVLKLIEKNHG